MRLSNAATWFLVLGFGLLAGGVDIQNVDWAVYGGHKTGDHFSALTQINRKNVGKLKQAWRFDFPEKGGVQTNPLVIGRMLFAYSPTGAILALDAATGKEAWRFTPATPQLQPS